MKFGNMTARQLFPRLLPVLAGSGKLGKHFVKSQEAVPSWMFLPWSNQLISSLHNEQLAKFIFPVAQRIADDYPNAVVYCVQICADNADVGGPAGELLSRLNRQLSVSSLHRRVLQGLALLTFPHIGLKDLVDNHNNLKLFYPDSWQERFNEECESFAERFLSSGESKGKLHMQFAKEHAAKIRSKDVNKMKSVLETQLAFEKKHASNLLKDFSPFLANFQGSDFEDKVEIPGQYTGLSRPDPRKHAYISEFAHTVTVFSSIRKPILVKMVGSNGRTYPFIVKAGEDLRQDQRIEQLFEICNRQLAEDVGVHHYPLGAHIETYSVVPLTKRLGLIEFVPNTLPMKDFISLVPHAQHQIDQATASYFKGMHVLTKEFSKAASISAKDFQFCSLVQDDAIVRNYIKAVDLVERFTMRRALASISSGAEGFYYLRKTFVSSYAVLSAVQWLLGKRRSSFVRSFRITSASVFLFCLNMSALCPYWRIQSPRFPSGRDIY
jgi:DNA-dependent protein kinase catalytic subunit